MGTITLPLQPGLAISVLLFTGLEWFVILACLAIVVGIIVWLIAKYGHWGAGGGGTVPTPPGAAEILELQQLLTDAKDGGMTAANCTRARELIRDARAAGIPDDLLSPLETELNSICD